MQFTKENVQYLYHELLYSQEQMAERFGWTTHQVETRFKEWDIRTLSNTERAELERKRAKVQARVFILTEIKNGEDHPEFVQRMGGRDRVDRIIEKMEDDPRYLKENPDVILNTDEDP